MNVEQLVKRELAGQIEVLGENPPQCHFLQYKSHMTWLGIELRPPWWETLSYGTVFYFCSPIITVIYNKLNMIGST
jgi:hypothetical protein